MDEDICKHRFMPAEGDGTWRCIKDGSDCFYPGKYGCEERDTMILNTTQQKELETVSRPLIEWMNKNCHPHVTAIVGPGRVELLEGVCSIPIEDYIPD